MMDSKKLHDALSLLKFTAKPEQFEAIATVQDGIKELLAEQGGRVDDRAVRSLPAKWLNEMPSRDDRYGDREASAEAGVFERCIDDLQAFLAQNEHGVMGYMAQLRDETGALCNRMGARIAELEVQKAQGYAVAHVYIDGTGEISFAAFDALCYLPRDSHHNLYLHAQPSQNAQGKAVGEIVPRFEGHSVVQLFDADLPLGTKLYTHAERARVPDGWGVKPSKATRDMVLAGIHENLSDPGPNVFNRIWAAMFAAAPSQPEDAA